MNASDSIVLTGVNGTSSIGDKRYKQATCNVNYVTAVNVCKQCNVYCSVKAQIIIIILLIILLGNVVKVVTILNLLKINSIKTYYQRF